LHTVQWHCKLPTQIYGLLAKNQFNGSESKHGKRKKRQNIPSQNIALSEPQIIHTIELLNINIFPYSFFMFVLQTEREFWYIAETAPIKRES
jgi:hypothetical protein